MAGKGGGAWKVAYADFVTAMMAFFMVMWLTSQSNELRQAVAEHFRNPGGKRFAGNEARSLLNTNGVGNGSRKIVRTKGTKKSEGDQKSQKMSDEGDRSNIGKVIPFDVNSTTLSPVSQEELAALLPELRGKSFRIEIRGHAASSGSQLRQATMDAWSISYQRSLSVMQFLIDQGIEPQRIRLSQAGSSEPRMSSDPLETLSDSRVEVFVLQEFIEEPETRAQRLVKSQRQDEDAQVLADRDVEAAKRAAAQDGGHH
jgi:chemotaxis protein MotB